MRERGALVTMRAIQPSPAPAVNRLNRESATRSSPRISAIPPPSPPPIIATSAIPESCQYLFRGRAIQVDPLPPKHQRARQVSPTKTVKTTSLLALLATAPLLISVSQAGTVTTTADAGPGSLRQAIADAAANETIDFDASLNGATIILNDELPISAKTLAIDASVLPAGIRISGNKNSRIFYITANSTVVFNRLAIIDGSKSNGNGGGIFASQSQINLIECSISNCHTVFDGAGFWGNGVSGSIVRCEIIANRSNNYGGGLFLIGVSSFDVSNSRISGNIAQIGGGIYNFNASPVLTNCVIQGNSGRGMAGDTNAQATIRNTIIWGNRTASGSNIAAMQLSNAKSTIQGVPNSSATVSNSLVEGASGSASFGTGNTVIWNAGNLDGALQANVPHFISAPAATSAPTTAGDLRVFTDSKVIDAGANSDNNQSVDLAGKPRVQNGIVDIGAYEGGYVTFDFLHPTLDSAADINHNGNTNFLDYALGLDPTAPGQVSADASFSTNDGSQYTSFSNRTNGVDIAQEWQTSANLAVGSWQPMIQAIDYTLETTAPLSADRQRVTLKLIPQGSKRFYRQVFTRSN